MRSYFFGVFSPVTVPFYTLAFKTVLLHRQSLRHFATLQMNYLFVYPYATITVVQYIRRTLLVEFQEVLGFLAIFRLVQCLTSESALPLINK